MHKHILVPTDGSPRSRKAIEYSVRLARDTGAEITFLNVQFTPPYIFLDEWPGPNKLSRRDLSRQAKSAAVRILEAADKFAKKNGVVSSGLPILDKPPFEAIAAAAKARRCDLIVMAAHGRGRLKSFLLGSETQKVLAHCKIPVLVHR